ncbi:MAG: oligosaccharide flippase family protein [candidate division WOR-3 bacterium]
MFKNVIYLFSSNLFSQVINFISGIIVIKMVSTKDFGSYSVATSFTNLFVIILGGFLTSAIRRFSAYYRGNNEFDKISGILKFSLIYSFTLSIVLTFPFLFFPSLISQIFLNSIDYSKFLFFYAFSIPFTIFSTYLTAYLSGFEKFKEISFSTNIFPNIFRLLFLIFWWLFLPFKEIGITLSLVFKSIINFLSSYYYSKEELKILKYNPKYEFKKWLKFSTPSFLRYAVSYLADNIGIIILGSLKDSLSAGIYRGANFISSILWNINIAFSSVLMPRITYFISQNKEELALKTLRKYYILNSFIILLFTIFIIFFGKYLLLLLGRDYVLGYKVLIILSFQALIGTISAPYEVYLEAKGRTDLNFINYLIYSISTIIFLYIFTKLYSKEGTAYAYLFGIIVLSVFRIIMFKSVCKNGIYSTPL